MGLTETFPVVQEDLYGASVSQPSKCIEKQRIASTVKRKFIFPTNIFLCLAGIFLFLSPDSIVYLWQGWRRTIKREFIPEDDDLSQQAVGKLFMII